MNSPAIGADSDGDDIDLRKVLVRLWRRKFWIVGSVLLGAGIFAAVAFVMTPIYRASVVLMPAANGGDEGGGLGALGSLSGVASLAGLNLAQDRGNTQGALAVLKSRAFLEGFMRERDLLPVLYEHDWDAAKRAWRDPRKAPTYARAHKKFIADVLNITEDRQSGLIMLGIEWRDGRQAADWANALVERLNGEMRERALREAGQSLEYLSAERNATTLVDLHEAITRLAEVQLKKRMLANISQEYAFHVLDHAMAPDEDDLLRPKRMLMVFLGVVIGGFLGIFTALIAAPRSPA